MPILVPGEPITPDDVKARWLGEAYTATDAQVQTVLDDALALIGAEVTLDTIDHGILRLVAVRMTIRHLKDREGLRSRTLATGPLSRTESYLDGASGLYLSADDRLALRGGALEPVAQPRGIYTVSLWG